MRSSVLALAASTALLASATAAIAQAPWVPGSEIVGQSATVQTSGVVNTVHFDPGGVARIVSPGGSVVQGTWTAAGGQLCLNTGAAQECFPYTSPFQAGQPITLTSSCQNVSTWTALSTNVPPPPPPAGERG